jgi:FKBP-type peptidyl-prolyl cis-trans isomerase SlyD
MRVAIREGDFIRLTYTGTIDGEVFDTTDENVAREQGVFEQDKEYEPVIVRVGAMHVILGLDEDLAGKEPGTDYEIDVPAVKAYGERDQELIKSAPVKEFKEKPTVGTRVQIEGREGVVVNIVGNRAVIDFNHVFAGRDLHYTYQISGIVESPEEQAQALIKLFSGREMDVSLDGGVLAVELPAGIMYDRRWLMGRGMIVHQIFEYIDAVDEVLFKESFKRPAKAEEAPEPAEPEPAEAENESE